MEWNNGALFIIFLFFLIPAVVIYILLRTAVKSSPIINTYIVKAKKENIEIYFFIEVGFIVLAIILAIGILWLINVINGGRGVLR